MKKFILTSLIFPALLFAQGTRPDQSANLILWVKADSMGKTYAGDAQIDSVRDWANSGEWFTQATAGNRPLARDAVSPTGLRGIDFDGSNDNLVNASSVATYKEFNGSSWTVFLVFMLDAANEVQLHWHNNAGTTGNVGSLFDLDAEGNFTALITHGVSSDPTYNLITTAEFDELDSVYYATILCKQPPDSLIVRMNGIRKGGQSALSSFNTGNSSVDGTLGHATLPLNGKLLEMFGFSDSKTITQIESFELYIVDKWIEAQAEAATRRRRVIISQ